VKKGLGFVGQVCAWLVILAVSAVLAVAVAVPRIAGAVPYTVLTSSMEPDLPPGTLIVVKPVKADEVAIGDVITYQLESGKSAVVTHRVVAKGVNGAGRVAFRTQGDANNTPDEDWVRPVQIKGGVWYSVPYLGYVNNLLTGKERQLGVYAAAAGLAGYALLSFVGAARDKRRSRSVKETADA
jgi:signal peptidase